MDDPYAPGGATPASSPAPAAADDGRQPGDAWFADPLRRAPLRLWRGGAWSHWLSDGATVWADPRPLRRTLGLLDLAALRLVDEVYLPELRAAGALDDAAEAGARAVLAALTAEAAGTAMVPGPVPGQVPGPTPGPVQGSVPGAVPGPVQWAASGLPGISAPPGTTVAPGAAPVAAAGTVAVGPTRGPSAVTLWWRRVRETVGTDVAVHGLAYLGVLLLFVGVFGLVAFAFGDVRPGVRPLAEVVCAAVPFVAAWWLLGHGARLVGRALEVVGALLLPVLLLTSLLDGFPVPPDPHGPALPVVATLVCGASAGASLAWSRRHPTSGVRYAVAPTLWLAAAMATTGVGRPVPSGQEAAVPSAAQTTAMLAALVVTTVSARRWPERPEAQAAARAAAPGTVVVGLLALLTWAADGWPALAVALGGALLLAQVELLADRLPGGVVDVLGASVWVIVALALLPGLPVAAVGAVSAAGFVALTELAGRRSGEPWTVAVPGFGVACALLLTVTSPWVAVGAAAVVTVWVVARRTRPWTVAGAGSVLDATAVAVPAWGVVALALATGSTTALVAATVLVAAATVPARSRLLRRHPGDGYWTRWWRGGLAVVVVGAAVAWPAATTPAERWTLVGVLVATTALAVAGPLAGPVKVWATTTLGTATWAAACGLTAPSAVVAVGVPAAAGLVLVLAAHRHRWSVPDGPSAGAAPVAPPATGANAADPGRAPDGARPAALHLGLAGHLLTGLAPVVAAGWWLTGADASSPASNLTAAASVALTLWLLALAFLVTALADDRDRSPVGAWCAQAGPAARLAPWLVVALVLPAATAVTLSAAGWLSLGDPWLVLVPAVTAVTYATVACRWGADRRRAAAQGAASLLAWVAVLHTAVASASSVEGVAASGVPEATTWPAVVGWAAVLAVGILLPVERRTPVSSWSAWLSVAPLTALVLRLAVPGDRLDDVTLAAMTGVVVGGPLALLGARTARRAGSAERGDRAGRGDGAGGVERADRADVASVWWAAPFVIGLLELAGGAALAVTAVEAPGGAWLLLAVAAVVVGLGIELRLGALAGLAVLVAWSATLWLGPSWLVDRAWSLLAVTAGVLLLAEALHRWTTARDPWARWDVPVLVAAAPVALTTLMLGADRPVPSWVGTGTLVLAVAVVLRRRGRPLAAEVCGAVAAVLVLVAATVTGTGWSALALTGLAAAHTGLALRGTGTERVVRQVVGVVAGWSAWAVALLWLGTSDAAARDVTVAVAAFVTVVLAALARRRPGRPERSWALAWGGSATLVVGALSVASLTSAGPAATPAVLVAAALVTGTAGAGAGPLRCAPARHVAGAAGLVTVLVGLDLAGAGPAAATGLLAALAAALAVTWAVLVVRTRDGEPSVGAPTAVDAAARVRAWAPTLAGTSAGATVLAVLVAAGATGVEQPALLLAPVLAGGAVQAAAAGVAVRSWGWRALAPVLACGAWWCVAAATLDGGAPLYTVPSGLALLAVVELWRGDLRRRGLPAGPREVVTLELVGIGLLVAAPAARAVTTSVVESVTVLLVGVLVAGWGAVTRVRRRVAAGAVLVLASVVLLVAVPLVALLPGWGGAAAWLLVAGAGLVAVLAATSLERGRAAVRSTWQRLGQDTAEWE